MIRIYGHGDHAAIAEIFVRAIHEIASEVYSPEQCLAWSPRQPNCPIPRTRYQWTYRTCFSTHIDRVHVEASICAKALFEKQGFVILAENMVRLGDVELLNYFMERRRGSPG